MIMNYFMMALQTATYACTIMCPYFSEVYTGLYRDTHPQESHMILLIDHLGIRCSEIGGSYYLEDSPANIIEGIHGNSVNVFKSLINEWVGKKMHFLVLENPHTHTHTHTPSFLSFAS